VAKPEVVKRLMCKLCSVKYTHGRFLPRSAKKLTSDRRLQIAPRNYKLKSIRKTAHFKNDYKLLRECVTGSVSRVGVATP
jgi:hypothetical protein